MGQDTDIEWCDSTVNCTTGCDGCELKRKGEPGTCYAVPIHEGRLASSFPALYDKDFHNVRLAPGRMAKAAAWPDLRGKARPGKPWLDGLPRMTFVGDLGDLFSLSVPFEYVESEVVDVAESAKGRRHEWMLLTKRPTRMAEFCRWLSDKGRGWPANVWPGTSLTSEKTVYRARVVPGIDAPNRFLSLEPLWGPLDFAADLLRNFRLVIVGGESGPRARPCDLSWLRSVRDQCRAAGVPVFVKQLGSTPFDSANRISIEGPGSHARVWHVTDPKGGDIAEFPEDLRVREFPALPRVTPKETPDA